MNMPEEEEGYRCVCDSGYEKNDLSCSLIGTCTCTNEHIHNYTCMCFQMPSVNDFITKSYCLAIEISCVYHAWIILPSGISQ